jgi:transglutaminase-like putative cysteine protease
MSAPARRVGARLLVAVDDPVRMTLQVAVADAGSLHGAETLRVTCDDVPIDVAEVAVPGIGRVHTCQPPAGRIEISYTAVVTGETERAAVTDADRIVFRRPSRYAESDRLAPMAQAEFAGISDPAELLAAVSSWVGSRLSYVPGSSLPTEGAVDTMLSRRGVCRDYAHLVIALLRALDVPARLVAVYAPGLSPMDFHAVVEADVDGVWRTVDATRLAPTSALVRICSGRDAADTAFLSLFGGQATLGGMTVTAVVDGDLPAPDDEPFPLP